MVPESDKHSLGTLSAEGKAVTQVGITVHKQSLGREISIRVRVEMILFTSNILYIQYLLQSMY